ncbi:Asparaginase/glutaminase [Moelleriella libera RCEF 2490]|uniref:asparaginase n=1 Tax=Moelleriella libera RCEF 2490 TaxID=1081109 RepID=A0A168C2D6_9HYPO|nr:Asparaginase/glutaminase [Moelleriella libera RCEF 2490]
MSAKKRTVALLSLGGTIVGSGAASTSAAYDPGKLPIKDVFTSIPEVGDMAHFEFQTLFDKGSPDNANIRLLLRTIQRCQERADIDAIIVSSGTDTLSELSTAVCCGAHDAWTKPIVFTGAMRPVTGLSADGPRNLHDAVKVAIDDGTRGRGTVAVMNSEIFQPPFFIKADANKVDAFTGGEAGPIGRVESDVVNFFWGPAQPKCPRVPLKNLDGDDPLPWIHIEYSYLGHEGITLDRLAKQEGPDVCRGLLLAGMGAGCWNEKAGNKIRELHAARGAEFPIVASRRTATGFVGMADIYGLGDSCTRAGYLGPEQAAIVLQMAVDNGWDGEKIKAHFHGA